MGDPCAGVARTRSPLASGYPSGMAYDERLVNRVRRALKGKRPVEKRMMGGICFLVHGHMCCGVDIDRLMVRVGPAAYERALGLAHAAPMDFTGTPLRGFVFVSAAGVDSQRRVSAWVGRGLAFVASLPSRSR